MNALILILLVLLTLGVGYLIILVKNGSGLIQDSFQKLFDGINAIPDEDDVVIDMAILERIEANQARLSKLILDNSKPCKFKETNCRAISPESMRKVVEMAEFQL